MTSDEKWLPVVGYEGYYEVSDQGNVRGVDRIILTRDGRTRFQPGRPIKAHLLNNAGYPFVRLTKNGKPVNLTCHRLVALAFIGPAPEGMEVCHEDGDRLNPHASNLRWDTRANNVLDAVKHGTHRNQSTGKTHCIRGHEFTETNTYVPPGRAERRCRQCGHDRYVAARDRHAT